MKRETARLGRLVTSGNRLFSTLHDSPDVVQAAHAHARPAPLPAPPVQLAVMQVGKALLALSLTGTIREQLVGLDIVRVSRRDLAERPATAGVRQTPWKSPLFRIYDEKGSRGRACARKNNWERVACCDAFQTASAVAAA